MTTLGSVGVGTTNPVLGKLQVKQSTTTHQSGFSVVNPADNSKLSLWGSGSEFNIDAIFTTTGSYKPLAFRTSNAERMRIASDGKIGINSTAPKTSLDIGSTDAVVVPVGTTGQRPTPAAGMFRYNTTEGKFEGYTTEWGEIGGGGGLTTAAHVANNAVVTLDLTAAVDHKVTATGICTITCTGGTEAQSHTIRIINSGSATVGFSTYFLFPSGNTPVLPSADGAINLVSFTVNRVGAAGTQLLTGASLNYS